MIMHEMNHDNKEVILMLHPMFSSSEHMKQFLCSHMDDSYRYLIPDLSGHGEDTENAFRGAKIDASAILWYLKKEEITKIRLGFGASLGAIVLMELLKCKELEFDRAAMEGLSFYENDKIMNEVLKPVFLGKYRRGQTDPKHVAVRMAEEYGKEAGVPMAKQFLSMSEESIKNIIYDYTHVNLSSLDPERQKKLTLSYGEKDPLLKEARRLRGRRLPKAGFKVWKDYGHCERISRKPEKYAEYLNSLLN